MAETATRALLSEQNVSYVGSFVRRAAHLAFDFWLLLALITPSWREGPFAWWPLLHFPDLGGGAATPGLLNLLPLLALAGWLVAHLFAEGLAGFALAAVHLCRHSLPGRAARSRLP